MLLSKGENMFLNQELLSSCEELFDQIANDESCEELNEAIDSLRSFLEKDVDGFTQLPEDKLAYYTQSRLEEIWRLISKEEKSINPDLFEMYQAICEVTEDACGYEAESDECDEDEE